jgi:Transposase DDE domain
MQLSFLLDAFLQLIPHRLSSTTFPLSPKAFIRQCKLTLPSLIVLLLSLTASGKSQGVDGKVGAFFRQARRSGLWPDADAVHRSTVTKARAKLSWTAFEHLHHDAVRLAYEVWPTREEHTWRGLSVFAIDGSKYHLPASDALRLAFDPDSGLDHPGKGHYPQCLVSTAYDVFRRLPVARTVQPMAHANERDEVKALLPHIPGGGVLLLDRGYPGHELIAYLQRHYQGYWLIRCPASATFPAVEAFVQSGRAQAVITLQPPHAEPIRLRALRLTSPDGERSVLLTNLEDPARFPAPAVIDLYFRRWAVEVHYRDEKTSLDIETFHSQTENGIRQELFAILIMAVIARTVMVLITDPDHPAGVEPQFKHAMITLASEAAILTPQCPALALRIFDELLREIARVQYYRPKTSRPSPPRVSKKPVNKWQLDKIKRLMNC